MVELHWRLAPRHSSLRLASPICGRRAPVALGGAQLDAPCSETCCAHLRAGALHAGSSSRTCAMLLSSFRAAVDWRAVWQRAQSLGVERMILLGYHCAASFCRRLCRMTSRPASSRCNIAHPQTDDSPVLLGRHAEVEGMSYAAFPPTTLTCASDGAPPSKKRYAAPHPHDT